MTNVNATPIDIVPGENKNFVYFTGAKAAQNDTITLTGVTICGPCQVMVDDGTDWVVDTFTVDQTTTNMINLTGATAGTVYGFAVVDY